MKKNLIALAIFGAFSGAALAQSNVTLYGIIDVNFQYNDPDASGASSTRGINSGHQSGSRWGVRGAEALSPALNAIFTLEGGFAPDLGTTSQSTPLGAARLFGRQAFLGLSGGWGTMVAGRLATFSSGTGSFDMFGSVDPFGTGWGDSSLGTTFTPSGAMRLDNAVLYQTPDFGGFKFGAGYSFNGATAEAAGSGNNNRVWFLGANFARGPFFAAITYDTIDVADGFGPGSATTPAIFAGASDQRMFQVGGSFDFKFLKIHGAYAKEDNVYFTTAGTTFALNPDTGADADAWMAGISVPLFGGSLLGSYQKRDGDPVSVCLSAAAVAVCPAAAAVTRERDVDIWAIGFAYPLSRRTNLYINFSDSDIENRTGPVPGATTPPSTTAEGGRKQYTVGIRHLF